MSSLEKISHYYRLNKPCANCPFLKAGGIELDPGRLPEIAARLLEDDHSTFHCHKTVHCPRGGDWNDEGEYQPSGHEAMCAGALAYMIKRGRAPVPLRFLLMSGERHLTDWSPAEQLVIDNHEKVAHDQT